jgi:transcriptional regulator with XRE-family HTH domain
MDRETLGRQLSEGRSSESLAREAGRAPSTVAHWAKKYGLSSKHAERHASRGGIEPEQLSALLEEGLSIRALAERLGVSYTTVRHWLRRYEMATPRGQRLAETAPARASGAEVTEASCPVHGQTAFVRRGADGFRCRLCRTGAVQRRRREIKRVLVDQAGGACVLCGYDRSAAGLHFHHLEPAQKSFALSRQGVTRSLAAARAEAEKCVLLCSNCRAEVESGTAQLPRALLL